MSREDVRPWGPRGSDARGIGASTGASRPVAARPDAPLGPRGGDVPRPFGGLGWRESATPGPLDEEIEVEAEDETGEAGDDVPDRAGEGTRRRRAREAPEHPRRTLAALGATVRVVRDMAGVPHVVAKSERDAWAGLGWCMAEDRRMHLELLRRLAQGRAAEMLGPSLVAHDALVRTVGVARRAALAASRLPGVAHDVLACFSAGVNASFAASDGAPEGAVPVSPWTIADSLSIEILRAFATSLRTWPAKLLLAKSVVASGPRRAEWIAGCRLPGATDQARLRAFEAFDLGMAELVAGLPIDAGLDGTAWAVSGASAGGVGALLHASPALPAAFYSAHLDTPSLRVAGCVPVGVPAFHVGRTSDLAWAGVPAIVDDCDVVLEEVDGIGNRRTPAGWEKLSSRRETIRVRDGASVVIEVLETRSGPLVSHLARQLAGEGADPRLPAVALHWGAGTVFSSVPAWLGVARATDAEAAGRAAAAFERSTQPVRIVVADRSGRTGAGTAGSIPTRDAGSRLPLLGWAGEGGWTGVRPVDASRTWRMAQEGADLVLVCAEKGPVPASSDACPRMDRLAEVRDGWTGERPTGSTLDAFDPVLARVLPVFRAALATSAHPAASALCAALESFDGLLRPEDRTASIALAALYHFLPGDLFPVSGFGPLAAFPRLAAPAAARILLAEESPWFPSSVARGPVVAAALLRAAAWLDHAEATSGRVACEALFRVPGDEVRASAGTHGLHVENGRPCGSPETLSMLDWCGALPPFAVGLAPTLRASCSLADPAVRAAVRGGAVAAAGHPHARDQVAGFDSGDLHGIELAMPVPGETLDLVAGS